MPYKNREERLAYRRRRVRERRSERGVCCLQCGGELLITQRKYCSNKCAKTYYDTNVRDPERTKEIHRKSKQRRGVSFIEKLRKRISCRVKALIKGEQHSVNYHNGVITYTESQLRQHLEKRFVEGMTWENYGTTWHIDHKIPVTAFNLMCDEDIKRCWSLKNLQPMFASENIRKSNKLDKPFQPRLI